MYQGVSTGLNYYKIITMQNIKPQLDGVYRMIRPERPIPVVYDSPHSGRTYPADFDYACDEALMRRAEDSIVDELLDRAPEYGIPLLCADFPRTYIDANRAPDDIEPDILCEPWPTPLNPTDRAEAGIGLIRRLIKPGIHVYNRKLDVNEIRHRIEKYYEPYHTSLAALLGDVAVAHGVLWHINWHSMPSLGAIAPFPHTARRAGSGQADFVLGDRNGTSCNSVFTHEVRDFFKNLGYAVAINTPYKGVEIVRRYGNPDQGRNSLQIEINKALYWDERKSVKNRNFSQLKGDIDRFSQWLANHAREHSSPMAAD